jgi:hypothetical protein
MLVVDTETQAINRSQPWPPRMVSVAVLVLHVAPDRIELHRTWSTLIRPDGFQVTGSSIHGITHQRAMTHGMPLRRAMSMVQEMMAGRGGSHRTQHFVRPPGPPQRIRPCRH